MFAFVALDYCTDTQTQIGPTHTHAHTYKRRHIYIHTNAYSPRMQTNTYYFFGKSLTPN